MTTGPLSGLVVIDASSIIGGPITASLLAEYGAMVIKVEHPVLGDGVREAGSAEAPRGLWWKFLSRNKRCVTCDLSKPDGAELFKQLVSKADVVIENFRPGRFEAWGLGYEELSAVNPALVMLRLTGFGQDGPYASQPGYGTLAEAMAGLAHLTGEADGPPTLPGVPLADGMAGIAGAAAVMFAVWSRDCGKDEGKGQVIDISLYSPLLHILGLFLVEYGQTGVSPSRRGNRLGRFPRNARICGDGKWVAYSVLSAGMLDRLIDFLQVRGDKRFHDTQRALQHADELDELLGQWIKRHDQAEVVHSLVHAGLPVAPVYDTAGIMEDPHYQARGDILVVPDEDLGTIAMPRGPMRFSRGSGGVEFTGRHKGAHNDEIFVDWLGLSREEVAHLARTGAI